MLCESDCIQTLPHSFLSPMLSSFIIGIQSITQAWDVPHKRFTPLPVLKRGHLSLSCAAWIWLHSKCSLTLFYHQYYHQCCLLSSLVSNPLHKRGIYLIRDSPHYLCARKDTSVYIVLRESDCHQWRELNGDDKFNSISILHSTQVFPHLCLLNTSGWWLLDSTIVWK